MKQGYFPLSDTIPHY